jgi:RNA polymerase sigma-70 factor, ECF subfamily
VRTGDEELLRRCLASSGEAWLEFVKHYQPLIVAAVWGTLRRYDITSAVARERVDDLVQQTFLKLCANRCEVLRRFDPRTSANGSLPAYLRAIATNLTIDHLRAIRPTIDLSEADEAVDSAHLLASDDRLLLETIDRRLEVCGKSDPERSRRVFWLHHRVGLTAAAIASMPEVGLTVKGVESLLLRLFRCIREELVKGKSPSASLQKGGKALGAAG